MTCNRLDALLSGGREAEFETHRATCPACDRLGRELSRNRETFAALVPPAWSPSLREALLAVPTRTVSCEGAETLLARAVEETLPAGEKTRLESHLSRCTGCTEAAAVLGIARQLAVPAPAPWLATRIAASRPAPAARRRGLRGLWNPKAAIAFAYAAAVTVMLLGFNPADLARKAGGTLQANTREALTIVRGSAVERIGEVQEKLARSFAVWKGRAGGYGRAALSNALALVMKPEPRRSPSRPRNEEGKGVDKKSETEILTWRA